MTAVIDPGFLAEMGWDPAALVCPPAGHPLVTRMVCRVDGCGTTATNSGRICFSCRRRLAEHGLGENDIGRLPARPAPLRGPAGCAVAGCAREWVSSRHNLCRSHADLRRALGLPMAVFLAQAGPLTALPECGVAACPGSAATSTVSTATPTSNGCGPPGITTLVWTKATGGGPSRRSAAVARSASVAYRRW